VSFALDILFFLLFIVADTFVIAFGYLSYVWSWVWCAAGGSHIDTYGLAFVRLEIPQLLNAILGSSVSKQDSSHNG
jgi:hypothetical protein